MTSDSVLGLIAEVRAADPHLADPREIADRVFGRIRDQGDPWQALAEVLPPYVVTHRNDCLPGQSMNAPRANRDSPGNPSTSTRWQGASRQIWLGVMARSISFGPQKYKFLGEVTLSDLNWLVEDRQKRAAELADSAKRFSRLLDAMVRHEAAAVGELEHSLVQTILDN